MLNAKYTVTLKSLMDDNIIRPYLDRALSSYPLYTKKSKEEYIPSYIPTREELNTKLLNHYKYREIGFETIARFLDELEIAMNEIMPKYNLLYLTADQDFNIIYNVDYKKTIDTSREGTNTNTINEENETSNTSSSKGTTTSEASDETNTSATVNNYNKNVKTSTPQGNISVSNKGIDDVTHADEISWSHDTNSESGSTSGTSETTSTSNLSGTNTTNGTNETTTNGSRSETEGTVETTKGNFGVVSAQDLILKYRETILNIDRMIIEDERIQELFMLVY